MFLKCLRKFECERQFATPATSSKTISAICLSIIIINLIGSIETWVPDIKPKISISFHNTELKDVPSFFGNITDFFKILDQDDTSILIGARNQIYNLTLDGLREKYKVEWYSSDADRELCALKGKSEHDCQNYIRVFARISSTQIFICGTNSYKPRCRFYSKNVSNNFNRADGNLYNQTNVDKVMEEGIISSMQIKNEKDRNIKQIKKNNEQYQLVNEIEAQGRCPYNPQHNSTYIYTDGQLYSATVADFSGADPLIYRETLRTEQYDLKQLNQPAFVNALERNGYVLFFFREISMEYMNCGKTVYSRVGRVCKNDRGGPYAFSDRWTSYLKARLNCSVPGEYPFYFDEIQSTSQIIDGLYKMQNNKSKNGFSRSSIVYAVFTTSVNAIPGSAVCAFKIDDILDAFEGKFKYQKDSTANWLPLSTDDVPEPRPGQCVDDSRTLSSTSANFVKTHTLMETSVASLYGKPLLTKVSLNYRLTAIAIDPQIRTIHNDTYDVIFVGTDNGKVIKFINKIDDSSLEEISTIVIAEMDALPTNLPVRELTISHKTQTLIVVGDGHIISLPLHYCSHMTFCWGCLNFQDPYCVWDINNYECKSIYSIQYHLNDATVKNFIQMTNSTENTKKNCKKYGGHTNDISVGSNINENELLQRPKVISTVIHGTVSGTGSPLHKNLNDFGINDETKDENVHLIYTNYKDQSIGQNDDSRITLTSLNPDHIDKNLYVNNTKTYRVEGEKLQHAGSYISWNIIIVVIILVVFAIGIAVGWHASRRLCKNSTFHTEHRNQLNPKGRTMTYRNSGKDVNLLMNSTNPFTQTSNNKKDNIEHEFVSEKDRTHECKNSTENLEKEVHFSKTGTLTKVKRTYI